MRIALVHEADMLREAIRGYVGYDAIFQEFLEVDETTDTLELAMGRFDRMLAYEKFMIEVEFLDEPDRLHRFLRFGTDATRMVDPIQIKPEPSI